MEQRHKVRLTTSNTFVLEQDEIKRLYIYLSLFQYRSLRIPNYNEQKLIETLDKDFKKFCIELQNQAERDPNNLIINKMRTFFDNHHKKLKEILDDFKITEHIKIIE
ncbi:MAG: hypothetical protein SNG27_05095 [Rikenellaceae bacterium]